MSIRYDYMLEHPEEMWRNYYRYYRRRVGPKVDVRLVLAVTISLISAGQYYFAWTNYNEAIKCLAAIPKYRIQVILRLFDRSSQCMSVAGN